MRWVQRQIREPPLGGHRHGATTKCSSVTFFTSLETSAFYILFFDSHKWMKCCFFGMNTKVMGTNLILSNNKKRHQMFRITRNVFRVHLMHFKLGKNETFEKNLSFAQSLCLLLFNKMKKNVEQTNFKWMAMRIRRRRRRQEGKKGKNCIHLKTRRMRRRETHK